MPIPSLVLGLIISLLIGAFFHLWLGGGLRRLLFYLILSVVGFATGQWIGVWRNWILFSLGPIDLGTAVVGSFIFLGMGHWLSLVQLRRPGDIHDEV
jgi:hypothetical protein